MTSGNPIDQQELEQFLGLFGPDSWILLDAGRLEDSLYNVLIARHMRQLDPSLGIGIVTSDLNSELFFNTPAVDAVLSFTGAGDGLGPREEAIELFEAYWTQITAARPDLKLVAPPLLRRSLQEQIAAQRKLSPAEADRWVSAQPRLFDDFLLKSLDLVIPPAERAFSVTLEPSDDANVRPGDHPLVGIDLTSREALTPEYLDQLRAAFSSLEAQGFSIVYFHPHVLDLPGMAGGQLSIPEIVRLLRQMVGFIGGWGELTLLALGIPELAVFIDEHPIKLLNLNLDRRRTYCVSSVMDAVSALVIEQRHAGQIDPACFYLENGFVFRQDGQLRRVIKPRQATLYGLLTSGKLEQLAAAGYVPNHRQASLSLGADRVVEVEAITHVTRPNEWSISQKKEALHFLCDFSLYLLTFAPGYYLTDPHLLNVTFRYSQPVYMDIGSLKEGLPGQECYEHLVEAFGVSGLLDQSSNGQQVREDLTKLLASVPGTADHGALFTQIKAQVDRLDASDSAHTIWSTYNHQIPPTLEAYMEAGTENLKTRFVLEKLQAYRPATMVDFGANDGWFAFFAAMLGTEVIAVDYVSDLVARGFHYSRQRAATVTFAVMDLIHLPQPMGFSGRAGSSPERLRSEFSLAAAITHHLSKAGMSFEAQADTFAAFTERYLAVEFIPREDYYVSQWGMPAWYTLDNYLAALSKHFVILEVAESSPEPRKWIFAERRRPEDPGPGKGAAASQAAPDRERRKILLGQLGSNGDCLHASIIARQIKQDFPGCHLTWAVSSLCRGMVEGNPHVDAIWEVPVAGWEEFGAAWYRFVDEAERRKAQGEFDEIVLPQIYPGNYHNFDGTVRPSVLRGYPRPITVPIEATLRLTDEEVAGVRAFAEKHRLGERRHVVLFECASKSGQSFVTPEFALQVATALLQEVPDCAILLSSHLPIATTDERLINASELTLRQNAELTKYCTLFVGCCSGVSCVALTDWARPLPMIQVVRRAVSFYGSFVHDLEYFHRPTDQFLELPDARASDVLACLKHALTAGFAAARQQFHQAPTLDFRFYLGAIRDNLLARGQALKAAHSLHVTVERYGWHDQLRRFALDELLPQLRSASVGAADQPIIAKLVQGLTLTSAGSLLPDRRGFNILLSDDDPERMRRNVEGYLTAFGEGDDVALHVLAGMKAAQAEAAVLAAIEGLGLEAEHIADISIVDLPGGPDDLPNYLSELDLFVGSPFLASWVRALGRPALVDPKADDLRRARRTFDMPMAPLSLESGDAEDAPVLALEQPSAGKYLVSAIVSTYKSEGFIRGCLEDLEAQTLADRLEIIVIDSGSPENERAIVMEFQQLYSNIRYYRTEREPLYQAWNRAIRLATGKYLTNANTDDRHRPDAFERMAEVLEQDPEIALVYGHQTITDQANAPFFQARVAGMLERPAYQRAIMLEGCHMGSQPMWRRSLHERVGYFDERLKSAGDYELWCRIAVSHKLQLIPDVLGAYYYNPQGIELSNQGLSVKETNFTKQHYRNLLTQPLEVSYYTDRSRFKLLVPMCHQRDLPALEEAVGAYLQAFGPNSPVTLLVWAAAHMNLADVEATVVRALTAAGLDESAAFADIEVTQEEMGASVTAGLLEGSDGLVALPHLPSDLLDYARILDMPCVGSAEVASLRQVVADWDPRAIDIVLLTHNRRAYLEQTVEALYERTQHPFRLIIVDNASDHEVLDYLARHRSRFHRVILNSANRWTEAFTQGIALTRSDPFIVSDPDVLVPERTACWLTEMLDLMHRHPEMGMLALNLDASNKPAKLPDVYVSDKTPHGPEITLSNVGTVMQTIRRRFFIPPYTTDWHAVEAIRARGGLVGFSNHLVGYHLGWDEDRDYPDHLVKKHHHFNERYGSNLYQLYTENPAILGAMAGQPGAALPVANLTSIVMLTWNQLPYTRLCIESLFKHTPEPFELIVVDNGSTDGTVDYLSKLASEHPNVKRILNPSNRGFAGGCNQGIAHSTGRYVLLLNNDTVVGPDWLKGLIEAVNMEGVGAVGPRTNSIIGPQLVKDVAYDPATLEGFETFAQEWRDQHRDECRIVNRVIGFCMLIRREVIDQLGSLDSAFGRGNFEDDDYCLRMTLAGFKLLIAEEVFIHHFGSVTFRGQKIDYASALEENWQIFRRKWLLPDSDERGYRFSEALALPFDPQLHTEPVFTPSVEPAMLSERKGFNVVLSDDDPERLARVVAAYAQAFDEADDVALHVLAGPHTERAQAAILAILAAHALDPEHIPTVSLTDAPDQPLELPRYLRAADLVVGSPKVLQGALDMGLPILEDPSVASFRALGNGKVAEGVS